MEYRSSGGTPDPVVDDTELRFMQTGEMKLAPGEIRELTVTADPPGAHEISFALLGDALDASLDQAKIDSGEDGAATVKLKAPSVPTSFRLRASLPGGAAAELTISVKDAAFGSVHVVPVYAGKRDVSLWTASVTPGSNCKSIAASFPGKEPENALMISAASPDDLVIDNVPAGPNLAVVLRAGSAMWGCTDAPNLQARSLADVKVTVVDRPLDLLATDMDVTFAFSASEPELYEQILSDAAAQLAESFLPASNEEAATALLDAMRAAASALATPSFDQQRADLGWDALVAQALSALPMSPQDQVKTWTLAALTQPVDPSAPPSSQITAGLRSIGQASGKALLAVSRLGDVDAPMAGIPETHLVSWTADASDTVMLGGSIFWLPSRYAGAAALAQAQTEVQGASTVPEALSQILGCDALSGALTGFDSCDAQCMKTLCESAIDSRWGAALDASADSGQIGEIAITASAPAKVDDSAAPLSFEGKWLGVITIGDMSTKVEGTVSGLAVPPPPPPSP